MKFFIATKEIVYNPSLYMKGDVRYFTSTEKALKWLGYVGIKVDKEYSFLKTENKLEEVDIEEGV